MKAPRTATTNPLPPPLPLPLLLALLPLCLACGRPGHDGAASPTLDPSLGWTGDHRQRLEELIAARGSTSAGYDPARPPVAVFDWDNTLIENDIGDGTLIWALQNDALPAPAEGWASTSRWLTPAAVAALDAACGEHPPGRPMPTSADPDCAGEIYGIYAHGTTGDGQRAFSDDGYDHRQLAPRYAWASQLWAGTTPAALESLAEGAIEQLLATPRGTTTSIGPHGDLPAWIRVDPRTADLLATLRRAGFDVWVVSASPEPCVRAFARRLDVPDDHVIGVRTEVDGDGRLTAHLAPCGGEPGGADTVMTYQRGKRCWINQQIFGVRGEAALRAAADPARRPLLAVGDADTDAEMLRDAGELRVLVDRHHPEVSCRALHDGGGSWLLEPPFHAPPPPPTTPYPCSSTACTDAAGRPVPCLDDRGRPIPDQLPGTTSAAATGGQRHQ